MLKKFIWQGMKPRCAPAKLIKHRLVGGSGYIDLEDYYLASVLTQLLVLHFSAITLGYNRILLTPSTKSTNLAARNLTRHAYTS